MHRGSRARMSMMMPEGGVNLKRTRRDRRDSDPSVDVTTTYERSETTYRPPQAGVRLEPTYRLEPTKRFSEKEAEQVAEEILEARLKHVKYDPQTCKALSQQLAGEIMEGVKKLQYPR